MKYTVFACFLFLFLLSPLCADTQIFDDAEKQFKKIRGPSAGARGAAYHSLRHKAVIKDVTVFQEKCKRLQAAVVRHKLGKDLQFEEYAKILQTWLNTGGLSRGTDRLDSKGGRMQADRVPSEHVLKLLESDFKSLRKYGLHDLPVDKKLTRWLILFEFFRLMDYCREVSGNYETYSRNLAWQTLFTHRLIRLKECAVPVERLLKREMGSALGEMDFALELNVIITYFQSMQAGAGNTVRKTRDSELKYASGSAEGSASKEDFRHAMRAMEELSRNIEKEWKERDRERLQALEEKRKEEERARKLAEREAQRKEREAEAREKQKAREAALEDAQNKKKEVPIERMSEEQLNARLDAARNNVFPKDDQSELQDGQMEQCKKLLTAGQQEQLESIRARMIRNGTPETKADIESLRTLRPMLNTKNFAPTKAETIQILRGTGE